MRRETALLLIAYGVWLAILFLLMSSEHKSVRNIGEVWMILLIWGPLLTIATLTALAWIERRIKRR